MRRYSAVAAILCAFAPAPGAERRPAWRNPRDGAIYVRLPPGEIRAGAEQYRFPHGFWMARTEVTVRQFEQFAAATGYLTDAEKARRPMTWRTPGYRQSGEHPVVWLSFRDALAYVRWAGVDLPTEAEWLYAAKAGTTTKFYWGDRHDGRYMWHRENSPGGPHPVARKRPNRWGLYDMIGNAWEFCKVATPDGRGCDGASAQRGASWTRCPLYKMRDGRIIDAIEYSLGPIQTVCPPPSKLPDDNPWDDDRGIRCIRRAAAGEPR